MSSLFNKTRLMFASALRLDFKDRARKTLLVVCGFGAGIVFRSMLAQKPTASQLASPSTKNLFQQHVLAAQVPSLPEPILQQVIPSSFAESATPVPSNVTPKAERFTVTKRNPVLAAKLMAPAQHTSIPQQAVSPNIEKLARSTPSRVALDGTQSTGMKQPVLAAPAPSPAQPEAVAQQSPTPSIPEPPKSTPPQVTYEAGQLTIVAENARLADVLSAVHKTTGADVDLPASASGERIWAQLGPGPARKVLATLLSETKLDYIIQASDVDPDGIRSVWLTPRTESPNAASTTSAKASNSTLRQPPPLPRGSDANRRIVPNSMRGLEPRVAEEPVIPEAPEVPAPTDPSPAAEPPAAAEATAGAQPQPTAADATSATPPPAAPTTGAAASSSIPAGAVPTPTAQASDPTKPPASATDQMIQTLQNMYEQRKQMQLARTPQSPN